MAGSGMSFIIGGCQLKDQQGRSLGYEDAPPSIMKSIISSYNPVTSQLHLRLEGEGAHPTPRPSACDHTDPPFQNPGFAPPSPPP